jgi:hypothetical protein
MQGAAAEGGTCAGREVTAAGSKMSQRRICPCAAVRMGREAVARQTQVMRPNQSIESDAAASSRIAATNASSAVISVSRLWTCTREPRPW